MTYLKPLQTFEIKSCESNKTAKSQSQTYVAVLNTPMLRELVKKF